VAEVPLTLAVALEFLVVATEMVTTGQAQAVRQTLAAVVAALVRVVAAALVVAEL
jgi:hypothetical protein